MSRIDMDVNDQIELLQLKHSTKHIKPKQEKDISKNNATMRRRLKRL